MNRFCICSTGWWFLKAAYAAANVLFRLPQGVDFFEAAYAVANMMRGAGDVAAILKAIYAAANGDAYAVE